MDCHEIWYKHPHPQEELFGDALTFHLAASSGEKCHLSNTLVQIRSISFSSTFSLVTLRAEQISKRCSVYEDSQIHF